MSLPHPWILIYLSKPGNAQYQVANPDINHGLSNNNTLMLVINCNKCTILVLEAIVCVWGVAVREFSCPSQFWCEPKLLKNIKSLKENDMKDRVHW